MSLQPRPWRRAMAAREHYFDFCIGLDPERGRASQYVWGYWHYFVFAAVGTFLLTIMMIEIAAEGLVGRDHVLLKLGGTVMALAAALAAPWLTVPGSVLLTGLTMAGMVTCGIVQEHRLHMGAE